MLTSPEYLLLIAAIVLLGLGTFTSWYLPDMYRSFLNQYSRLYTGWDKGSAYWINSRMFFWMMRIGNTVGFLACLFVLARLLTLRFGR